jgi:hypothetical protein
MGFRLYFYLDDEEAAFDENIIDINNMNLSLIKMYDPEFMNTMYILNMMKSIRIYTIKHLW